MSAMARHRWLDRLLGAAVGIAAAAWWFGRARDEVRPAAAALTSEATLVASALPDAGEPAATKPPAQGSLAIAGDPATAVDERPTRDLVGDTNAPSEPARDPSDAARDRSDDARDRSDDARDRSDAARDESDAAPPTAAPSDAPPDPSDDAPVDAEGGDAPTLPLPRMPGDTRLSSTARFDAESSSWVLKAAYRVHARDHHVIAFYRKALLDQGLSVSLAEDPPTPDGAVKTYIRGKSSRIHAQVGIMPRTGSLETRVWILWRTRS